MNTKRRNATVELLRIVAMIMIICLHGLDKGGLLKIYVGSGKSAYLGSWLLESLAIVGLNLYVLITGYFMVKAQVRIGRFIEIVLTIIVYSVGIFGLVLLLSKIFGIGDVVVTANDLFKCIFPIHMETYWFCTAYVVLYLFLPVISVGVRSLSKKALGIVIIFMLVFETAFKSFCPFIFEIDDKGYSSLWFITLFLIAAYIRLYGIPFINNVKRGLLVYFIGAAFIFIEEILIQFVYNRFGHLELLERISYDYNHIFVVAASVGLFAAFINMREIKGKAAGVIGFFSAGSFGVYLIHEHIYTRFEWPKWLGIENLSESNPLWLIVRVILSACLVYIVCAVADKPRQLLFTCIKNRLEKSHITAKLSKMEKIINGEDTSD